MRQIKFRVRNTTTEKIVGYESLFPQDMKSSIYKWASSGNGRDWQDGILETDNFFVFEREQYVGIQDVNGRDIYENDILKSPHGSNPTYAVKYSDTGFYLDDVGQSKFDDRYEVVGNIYQTPEILNKN